MLVTKLKKLCFLFYISQSVQYDTIVIIQTNKFTHFVITLNVGRFHPFIGHEGP